MARDNAMEEVGRSSIAAESSPARAVIETNTTSAEAHGAIAQLAHPKRERRIRFPVVRRLCAKSAPADTARGPERQAQFDQLLSSRLKVASVLIGRRRKCPEIEQRAPNGRARSLGKRRLAKGGNGRRRSSDRSRNLRPDKRKVHKPNSFRRRVRDSRQDARGSLS
jgi:hypothetical protein